MKKPTITIGKWVSAFLLLTVAACQFPGSTPATTSSCAEDSTVYHATSGGPGCPNWGNFSKGN
jgi:hypothetical protein